MFYDRGPEFVTRTHPRSRIRYRNEPSRPVAQVYRTPWGGLFQAPPYLDYVVRLCCRGQKERRYVCIVLRNSVFFWYDTSGLAAAACYIVALDIDHAEKLQRVKRNLRCWGCLKIDGTPWEVRPRSRIPVKLSPNSIVFFHIEYIFGNIREYKAEHHRFTQGLSIGGDKQGRPLVKFDRIKVFERETWSARSGSFLNFINFGTFHIYIDIPFLLSLFKKRTNNRCNRYLHAYLLCLLVYHSCSGIV